MDPRYCFRKQLTVNQNSSIVLSAAYTDKMYKVIRKDLRSFFFKRAKKHVTGNNLNETKRNTLTYCNELDN